MVGEIVDGMGNKKINRWSWGLFFFYFIHFLVFDIEIHLESLKRVISFSIFIRSMLFVVFRKNNELKHENDKWMFARCEFVRCSSLVEIDFWLRNRQVITLIILNSFLLFFSFISFNKHFLTSKIYDICRCRDDACAPRQHIYVIRRSQQLNHVQRPSTIELNRSKWTNAKWKHRLLSLAFNRFVCFENTGRMTTAFRTENENVSSLWFRSHFISAVLKTTKRKTKCEVNSRWKWSRHVFSVRSVWNCPVIRNWQLTSMNASTLAPEPTIRTKTEGEKKHAKRTKEIFLVSLLWCEQCKQTSSRNQTPTVVAMPCVRLSIEKENEKEEDLDVQKEN